MLNLTKYVTIGTSFKMPYKQGRWLNFYASGDSKAGWDWKTSGLITGFGDAMKKGFVLDWMRAQECAVCEESNGHCIFDPATKQSRCLCSDGRTEVNSCEKGTRTPFISLKNYCTFFLLVKSLLIFT